MPHAFISYVREDSVTVQRLSEQLKAKGVDVWLDRESIRPGVRWKDAIRNAIRQGDFFISCFSDAYHKRMKTYMNEELTLAIEELRQLPAQRVWFIPVLLCNCQIPDFNLGAGSTLRDIQGVALYENWDEGVNRILDVIRPTPAWLTHWIKILDAHKRRDWRPRCTKCGTDHNLDNIYICNFCGADYCRDCVRKMEHIGRGPPYKVKCPCGGELW